jgi:2-amino-4-hydroxy-6-hydroxymethyldihydropteridine diphosphokinase
MEPEKKEKATVYIALGANLGDTHTTLKKAIETISTLSDTHLLRRSSLYTSTPFEAEGPDFVNAVIGIQTTLLPLALLQALQKIERTAKRQRPYKNAPRTLDLDVLLYDDLQIQIPTLTIPHPRMYERAFVLWPLSEIAPHLVDPYTLYTLLVTQGIKKLEVETHI